MDKSKCTTLHADVLIHLRACQSNDVIRATILAWHGIRCSCLCIEAPAPPLLLAARKSTNHYQNNALHDTCLPVMLPKTCIVFSYFLHTKYTRTSANRHRRLACVQLRGTTNGIVAGVRRVPELQAVLQEAGSQPLSEHQIHVAALSQHLCK